MRTVNWRSPAAGPPPAGRLDLPLVLAAPRMEKGGRRGGRVGTNGRRHRRVRLIDRPKADAEPVGRPAWTLASFFHAPSIHCRAAAGWFQPTDCTRHRPHTSLRIHRLLLPTRNEVMRCLRSACQRVRERGNSESWPTDLLTEKFNDQNVHSTVRTWVHWIYGLDSQWHMPINTVHS